MLCRGKRRDGEKQTEEDQEDAHGRRVWVQVVALQTLRKDVLRVMHDAVTIGHLGTRRTLMVMQPRFYWPQMKKFVCRVVPELHQVCGEEAAITESQDRLAKMSSRGTHGTSGHRRYETSGWNLLRHRIRKQNSHRSVNTEVPCHVGGVTCGTHGSRKKFRDTCVC